MFEFKHPNTTGIRYYFLHRAQKAQWQESIVSFTSAGNNVFWKSHFVANSHQKCLSGFLTEITFTVQMFNSPTTSCKTVKGSLQTPQEVPLINEMTTRTVVVDICYLLNIWCTKQCEREKKNSNSKNKRLTQSSQKSVLALIYKHRTIDFRKWCLNLKTD